MTSIARHTAVQGSGYFRGGALHGSAYADFDASYQPINGANWQGASSHYTVQNGDTLPTHPPSRSRTKVAVWWGRSSRPWWRGGELLSRPEPVGASGRGVSFTGMAGMAVEAAVVKLL